MSAAKQIDDAIAALPEELRDAARSNAIECAAQGLPAFIDDPVLLDRCARIITTPAATATEEVA